MLRKAKTQIPEMDDIIAGQPYAFTYNPSDKHQYFGQPNRLNKSVVDLDSILLYKSMKYELYPELSRKGRIHFHGYVVFDQIVDGYMYSIPLLLKHGTVVIKQIDDNNTWLQYCLKQYKFHEWSQNQQLIQVPIMINQ